MLLIRHYLPKWVITTTTLIGLVMLTSGSMVIPATPPQPVPGRPNILLLIADDWGAHAGFLGDKAARTPFCDSLARQGVVFSQAFAANPFCTPSRAALVTGLYPHRLEEGANQRGTLPVKFPNYTTLLEEAGYHVGSLLKGWAPGKYTAGGYTRNPAGKAYANVNAFLAGQKPGQPFCLWFGSPDPHRPYEAGEGVREGFEAGAVQVPGSLPDNSVVRSDFLDYYSRVARFDRQSRDVFNAIRQRGLLKNTIVIVTSDNGMPVARGKSNLYDEGTHVPLMIWWPDGGVKPRRENGLVSLVDLMPTFLESAGLPLPAVWDGISLVDVIQGKDPIRRQEILTGRERQLFSRPGNVGYPSRAVRTGDYLYIRNFAPDRYPLGVPDSLNGREPFLESGTGPSIFFLKNHRNDPAVKPFYDLSFAKRPAEELYDLRNDPGQLKNVAQQAHYKAALQAMRRRLLRILKQTKDPRATGTPVLFDIYPYYDNDMRES